MRQRRTLTLALPLAVALASCAGGHDALTSLRYSVDEFHDGFRWGAMGSMLPHVAEVDRAAFPAWYEAMIGDVEIADYEVHRVRLDDDRNGADVWVRLAWIGRSDMVVREATIRERWVWSRPQWYRAEAIVERGDLPGFGAPAPAGAP